MNALDWLSSGARLTSWFHQLSVGKSARPLKSSLRATPVDGDGVDGVSVGAVGTDGDSFAPPQAAARMLHTTSAVMSTVPPPPLRGFGVASALSHLRTSHLRTLHLRTLHLRTLHPGGLSAA